MPARTITNRALSTRERANRRAGLQEARRDMIARTHPRLSQCYDYFQFATEDEEHTLIHLYKMVETIEEDYGGEQKAGVVFGMQEIKAIKRLANDRSPDNSHDQRHAPISPGTGTPLTDAERTSALDDGRGLLRKCEERLARSSPPAGSRTVLC